MKDSRGRLSPLTIAFHWAVAIGIIGMLSLGFYMKETESYNLYDIHKSIGVLLLIIIVARSVWRLMNGWPVPAGRYSTIEIAIARFTHWTLLVTSIIMPVSGAISSGMGGNGIAFFGLTLVPKNMHPTKPFEAVPHNESVASFSSSIHEIVAWILVAVIVLHVFGALKHHIVDKDGTLRRILGAKVD